MFSNIGMGLIVCPYLISQYFWFFVALLPMIGIVPYFQPTHTKDFFSQSSLPPWNSSKLPVWFLHIGDLHLSSTQGNFNETFQKLDKAVKLVKPMRVLVSGDVTDSRSDGFQPYQKVLEEDWNLYKKLLSEIDYPSEKVIAVAGNHDVYNLRSFDSPRHFANGILYNKSTFPVARFIVDDDISVVTVNPYRFPLPPKGMLDWAFPDSAARESIGRYLQEQVTHYTIVLGHHPALMWYPNYASTANVAFPELLTRSKSTRFYLSGGLDVKSPQFYHHGDAVEVVGMRMDKSSVVGVVTFDNYRAGYHSIDLSHEGVQAVITSPAPEGQVSGLDMFDQDNGLKLRVLVFSGNPVNLQARGHGISGESLLTCSAMPGVENIQLCELPLGEVVGDGTIFVRGDWTGNVSFAVTSTYNGMPQKPYADDPSSIWTFLAPGLAGFALVMTLPIKFTGVGEAFDRWMRGRDATSHWMFAFFGGFLATHQRFMEAPRYFTLPVFLSVLWSLVFPSVFFMLDNAVAVVWHSGYICDGTAVFNFLGMRYNVFFLYFIVFPLILFASSVEVTRAHSWAFVFDCIVYIASFAGWFYAIYELSTVFTIASMLTSPIFVFFPIYLHSVLIVWTVKTVRHDRMNTHVEVPFISVSLIDEE